MLALAYSIHFLQTCHFFIDREFPILHDYRLCLSFSILFSSVPTNFSPLDKKNGIIQRRLANYTNKCTRNLWMRVFELVANLHLLRSKADCIVKQFDVYLHGAWLAAQCVMSCIFSFCRLLLVYRLQLGGKHLIFFSVVSYQMAATKINAFVAVTAADAAWMIIINWKTTRHRIADFTVECCCCFFDSKKFKWFFACIGIICKM